MSYHLQKKIRGDMERLSARQKRIGTMENYESCYWSAWSSSQIEKTNYQRKILHSHGDNAEQLSINMHFAEILSEITRTMSGSIEHETPPEYFHQIDQSLNQSSTSSSRLSMSATMGEQEYVERGENTEDFDDHDKILLQEEKRSLQVRLDMVERNFHECSNNLMEYQTQNRELKDCLSDRETQLQSYWEMEEKLKSLEDLLAETKKKEEEFGRNFERTCKEMHLDKMLGSTKSVLEAMRNIILPCSSRDGDELSPTVEVDPQIEKLNEIICELQEISHLSKESVYNCTEMLLNFETTLCEIVNMIPKHSSVIDTQTNTGSEMISVKKRRESLVSHESWNLDRVKKEEVSSIEEKFYLQQNEIYSNSSKSDFDPMNKEEHFAEYHGIVTEEKASGTINPNQISTECQTETLDPVRVSKSVGTFTELDQKSIECQTETVDRIALSQSVVTFTNLAAYGQNSHEPEIVQRINSDERAFNLISKSLETESPELISTSCQTEVFDQRTRSVLSRYNLPSLNINPNSNVSDVVSLMSQEEKKSQRMIQNQERSIDELNRELLVKKSELEDIQMQFNDLGHMNRNLQENIANLQADNDKLIDLIEILKVKIKANPQETPKPQKSFESKATQSVRPLNISPHLSTKSISGSLKESLQHIEESHNLELSYRSLKHEKNFVEEEKSSGPPKRKLSKATISYKPLNGQKKPTVDQKKTSSINNINTISKEKMKVKQEVTKRAQMMIEKPQDAAADGDLTPEINIDNPNVRFLACKIIKTGFNSLDTNELCYLHYQIVTAEMMRKSDLKRTIHIKSQEISCTTSMNTIQDCCRIDALLTRLQVCKQKARDLKEKLLYASLEKILMCNE